MTERERPPFPFPFPRDETAPAGGRGESGNASAADDRRRETEEARHGARAPQSWMQEWEHAESGAFPAEEGQFDLPLLDTPASFAPFPPSRQLLPEEIAALSEAEKGLSSAETEHNADNIYIAEAQAEGLMPIHQISEAWEQPPADNILGADNPLAQDISGDNVSAFLDSAVKTAGSASSYLSEQSVSSETLLREQKLARSNRARIKRNFRRLFRHSSGEAGGSEDILRAASIIPKKDMHGFALIAVIAIMSFLAAWMLFAAHCIGKSAVAWSAALERDAVVQIMPEPDQNMDKALKQAAAIAKSYSGVLSAHIVSKEETQELLSPWLGVNANIDALPVPRLVLLQIDPNMPPDFERLKANLQKDIKGVRFDSSQAWAERLAKGARIVLGGILGFLALVLAAMVMTIIFATRGALAGNTHIIEVLHFIGADDNFIAHIFDTHFFRTGLKGAALGGAGATVVFILLFFWISASRATPEGSEMAALFGRLEIDWLAIAEFFTLMLGIALLTMATSHCTVMRCLRRIDDKSGSFFSNRD